MPRALTLPRTSLIVVIALVTALGLVTVLGAVADARAATTIKVADNFFKPDRKSVRKGTKVKFKWVGSNNHNVTKASGPGGGFASQTTDDRGVNFKKKFKKKGEYKIICTLHAGMKMTLKVR
jgi:plastocyanin